MGEKILQIVSGEIITSAYRNSHIHKKQYRNLNKESVVNRMSVGFDGRIAFNSSFFVVFVFILSSSYINQRNRSWNIVESEKALVVSVHLLNHELWMSYNKDFRH